jgi:DNA (cytosine-5)-methyltransferase 1
MKLDVLELFAGIGGFTEGLEATGGFKTVAFVEKDEFRQKVLKKNNPGVEVYDEVTNFRYKKNVDLVTAGFPCQDVSIAGERAGLTGERTGLFWYVIRTLCMVGRTKALLENVADLLTNGLSTILGALATFGYDTEWHCIPASYVGAWHERDRIWIFADPNEINPQGVCKGPILGQSNLSQQLTRSFEKWEGRSNLPESRFCRKNDGVPDKVHRLKALGDAVVSQIPEIWGNAILEADKNNG